MPYYRGKVYRGVSNFNQYDDYEIGTKITWKRFTSLSKNIEVANFFASE
jgi:hypothetical protein